MPGQPGMLRLMTGLMTGGITQRKRPIYVPVTPARTPAGPAITALRAVAASTACIIRCLTIAYIALQVAIWHSFYLADPWRLAGPLAAMAWAALVVAYLRGRWGQGWWRDGLDSAASVLLAFGAGWCVPATVRVAIAAAAWCARLLLERGAFAADATLARADREAREQRVALSRTTERREHERLLH